VEAWSTVFEDRRVCFVYGAGSRHSSSSEIFDACRKVGEILAPPTDAYESVGAVLAEMLKRSSDVDIFSVALGPTGTVLAARGSAEGLRVLDIGHLSASMDAALHGGVWPDHLPLVAGEASAVPA
jgi:hypothetical protein